MSDPRAPLVVPIDVVEEILRYLLTPYDQGGGPPYNSFIKSHADGGCAALARCARACRAFQRPAFRILWEARVLTDVCRAILPSFVVPCVRGLRNEDSEDEESDVNVEGNEDWGGSVDKDFHPRTDGYLSGPIRRDEWSRFELYAQFIRILYNDERLDSSVFFYLHQHTHGTPLFPNLRELIWGHATPEIVSVISPSIRLLDLDGEENNNHTDEIGYRMRRHAFTTLLPGILCSIPELRELRIRPLGHPGFWDQFAPPHNRCFVAQNVRILHISESFPILMGGALPVVSTIQELASLNIGFPESDWDDHANYDLQPDDWDKGSIHPLSKLRHLQITSRITAIATLVDAIVAPELEDIQLESTLRESSVVAAAAIRAVLGTLCSRNKSSIRKVHLDLRGLEYNPRRDSTQSSEFGASIFTLLKPTLQFQHLRELSILVSFGFRKPLEFPGPTMLTAWPNLRKLLLHGVVISPDSLRAAARACPHLQSLTAQGLSEDFRHIPASTLDQHDGSLRDASSSNAGGHGLQELRLLRPSDMVPADVIKIAQFLAGLFPRLCAERSSGRGIYSSRSWNNVLKELTKIQVSQGSRRA